MATARLSDFLRRLTCGMAAEMLVDHSDPQLVKRALSGHDEAAFQAIVHRHGAMVYRVCWRVLQHPQDTEDAFQATFLILAQKLHTVRKHASLASWLHGVAHRVALKAKAQSAARRCREHQAALPDTLPADDVTWGEFRSALDVELGNLADKWRLPLIMCYLEGRTQDEAASQLGWSKSTLRRRLEQARAALGCRLKERGIVWSAALSAVLLSDCVASATPAPTLVALTIEAAADVAAGKAVATAASAKVAVLTQGVMKAMFLTKLKTVTAVLLVVGMITFGGELIYQVLGAGQSAVQIEDGAKKQPKQTDEQKDEKEAFTAWGKELGGLQAGLGYRPGEKRAYSHGETVKLVVRVRNVGKQEVKFQYFRKFLMGISPVVTDSEGKPVPFDSGITAYGKPQPQKVYLAPGKEIEIYELEIKLRPLSESGNNGHSTLYGTGKFRVQYERLARADIDPILSKLATGKLELEINPKIKAPDAPAAEPKDDKARLQGTWHIVEVRTGEGPRSPREGSKDQILVFTGDKLVFNYDDGSSTEMMYQIDPKQKPKTIDLVPTAKPESAYTFKGIYEIDGDRLKLYYSRNVAPDARRPARFDAQKEPGDRFFILKQAPKKAKDEDKQVELEIKAADQAKEFRELTLQVAGGVPDEREKAELLRAAAVSRLKAGDRKGHDELLAKALRVVDGLPEDRKGNNAQEDLRDHYKARFLVELAGLQAQAGDPDLARRTAGAIPIPQDYEDKLFFKAQALGSIAWKLADAGDIQGAKKTMDQIEESDIYQGHIHSRKAVALFMIASAQAKAGDVKGALATAEDISNLSWRAWVLSRIAVAQANANDEKGSIRSLERALEFARKIPPTDPPGGWHEREGSLSNALYYIMEARAVTGDVKGARKLAEDLPENERESRLAWAFVRLGQRQAAAGDVEGARKTADTLFPKGSRERGEVLLAIVKAQLAAGNAKSALETAAAIAHWEERALALVAIARAHASQGHSAEAANALRDASSLVGEHKAEKTQSRIWIDLSLAWTENGNLKATLRLINEIPSPREKVYALLAVGEALEAQAKEKVPRKK
jgi:RNA polymerase sigma factor (sigma-70 family)